VITPCRSTTLTTTLILDTKNIEEDVMMNWTDEALRAEAEYRRERLHRMASHRSTSTRRTGAWHRWLNRGPRH
jgi:hypothetical protein